MFRFPNPLLETLFSSSLPAFTEQSNQTACTPAWLRILSDWCSAPAKVPGATPA